MRAEDLGVDADERHPGLDQPAGHQQARAEEVAAVAVADRVAALATRSKASRVAAGRQQGEGPLLEPVQPVDARRRASRRSKAVVELVQQRPAAVEPSAVMLGQGVQRREHAARRSGRTGS